MPISGEYYFYDTTTTTYSTTMNFDRGTLTVREVSIPIPIMIVGSGGIGSNLAYLLAGIKKKDKKTSTYKIILIDFDVTDEKFYERFVFATTREIGIPKVEAVKNAIKERLGVDIEVINKSLLDIKIPRDFFTGGKSVITVDSIETRNLVETKLLDGLIAEYGYNINEFFKSRIIHVGCNLNSVSIYKTAKDLIGDDTPILEGTSYDVVPDVKTYLEACVKTIERLSGTPISIFDEWIPPSLESIPFEYAMEGWVSVELDGHQLQGKPFELQIKGVYQDGNFYKLKEKLYPEFKISGFIGYDHKEKRFYVYGKDGRLLYNPHTMAGHYQCTGDIPLDRIKSFKDVKRSIESVLDSLETPNLDSALRTNFGHIDLNDAIHQEKFYKDGTGSINTVFGHIENIGHIEDISVTITVGGEDLHDPSYVEENCSDTIIVDPFESQDYPDAYELLLIGSHQPTQRPTVIPVQDISYSYRMDHNVQIHPNCRCDPGTDQEITLELPLNSEESSNSDEPP